LQPAALGGRERPPCCVVGATAQLASPGDLVTGRHPADAAGLRLVYEDQEGVRRCDINVGRVAFERYTPTRNSERSAQHVLVQGSVVPSSKERLAVQRLLPLLWLRSLVAPIRLQHPRPHII